MNTGVVFLFVSVAFFVFYFKRKYDETRSYNKYKELFSLGTHTNGYVHQSEFSGFQLAVNEQALNIGYGRVNTETGLQHYVIIKE